MAVVYVAEHTGLVPTAQSDSVLAVPAAPLAEQTVAITAGSVQVANAFNTRTRYIEVSADAVCSIAVGSNPTATVINRRLAANERIYLGVNGGEKIAVITNT